MFLHILNSFISLDRYLEKLEEDLFTSLENIHCDEARFQIRLSQIRMNTSPNFAHPPPVSLFKIHNRLYYENEIFNRLWITSQKVKEHKRRVEQRIAPLLMNLPQQYVNITFNWYVEDMQDDEDEDWHAIRVQRWRFLW